MSELKFLLTKEFRPAGESGQKEVRQDFRNRNSAADQSPPHPKFTNPVHKGSPQRLKDQPQNRTDSDPELLCPARPEQSSVFRMRPAPLCGGPPPPLWTGVLHSCTSRFRLVWSGSGSGLDCRQLVFWGMNRVGFCPTSVCPPPPHYDKGSNSIPNRRVLNNDWQTVWLQSSK